MQYLLYDGHGSTRQIAGYADNQITVYDDYSYDGYGVLLQDDNNFLPNGTLQPGKVGTQATSLLYAGEHFDFNAQQYYNRARWYNPLSGLFNQVDPYAGNLQDPQSLHKYLYCHANPINGIDPSGQFALSISGLSTVMSIGIVIAAVTATVLVGYFLLTSGDVAFALTGSEPVYNPALWNSPNYISFNNCYAYAVNDPVPYPTRSSKPQPGVKAGSSFISITVSGVKTAAIADGLKYLGATPRSTLSINSGDYIVALVVAPGVDYHWYRHNPDRTWSHKPGGTAATSIDASGALITDPRTADRNYGVLNYTDFGGFFAVPAGGIRVRP